MWGKTLQPCMRPRLWTLCWLVWSQPSSSLPSSSLCSSSSNCGGETLDLCSRGYRTCLWTIWWRTLPCPCTATEGSLPLNLWPNTWTGLCVTAVFSLLHLLHKESVAFDPSIYLINGGRSGEVEGTSKLCLLQPVLSSLELVIRERRTF